MNLYPNVEIHSLRRRSTIFRRALAGIIVLIAVQGALSLDEGIGDVHDKVDSRINETISSSEEENPLYAVALTSRHLQHNELFGFKLDLITKFIGNERMQFMGFGITNLTTADLATETSGIQGIEWLNFFQFPSDYDESRPDVQNFIKNGYRMGVMLNRNGSLTLFSEGVNEFVGHWNITGPVYGAVILYSMGLQASIVEHSFTEGKE